MAHFEGRAATRPPTADAPDGGGESAGNAIYRDERSIDKRTRVCLLQESGGGGVLIPIKRGQAPLSPILGSAYENASGQVKQSAIQDAPF